MIVFLVMKNLKNKKKKCTKKLLRLTLGKNVLEVEIVKKVEIQKKNNFFNFSSSEFITSPII